MIDVYCAQTAVEQQETLYGTASPGRVVWLLLEYLEPWASNATEENQLPPAVQQWFSHHLQTIPNSHLLFIKQERPVASPGRRFFVAVASEQEPQLFAFDLPHYEALLEINLPDLLANPAVYSGRQLTDPLLLICTHGKRDKCCAKFGLPLYQAFHPTAPEQVWQCSHTGGHRYAATALVFPSGVGYGFLTLPSLTQLWQETLSGRVHLSHYRGRACFPPAVQAAEYFIRRHTELLEWSALRWLHAHQMGQQWQVRWQETATGREHLVVLTMQESEPVLEGCSKGKFAPRPLYHLEKITS